MSNLNHVITLGIGTPGDIEHFILFGLSPSTSPVTEAYTWHLEARELDLTLPARDLAWSLGARDLAWTLPERT